MQLRPTRAIADAGIVQRRRDKQHPPEWTRVQTLIDRRDAIIAGMHGASIEEMKMTLPVMGRYPRNFGTYFSPTVFRRLC